MKNFFLLLLFLFLTFPGLAQDMEVSLGTEHKVTRAYSLDLNKVYHKQTGKKLPPEMVELLLRTDPKLRLEPEFGEDGQVTRFVYYPREIPADPAPSGKLSVGQDFPEFNMVTTNGKEVRLQDLKGKVVLLHFALDAMRFRYDELDLLDTQIKASDRKDEIIALVVLGSSEERLAPQFDAGTSSFELVNNGTGYIQRYGLSWLPITLVIDRDGRLLGSFKSVDDLDLNSYL